MATTYATRTFGTPTNAYKFTISFWAKRSALGGGGFSPITAGTYQSTNMGQILFAGDDTLLCQTYNAGGSITMAQDTNMKFRDVNGWYHIVLGVDGTLGTAGDRQKLYVNGELITSLATDTNTSQNSDLGFNQNGIQCMLGNRQSANYYYDGYLSHVHFIDGTQYAASDFGSTDSTTGEWKIKTSPSVTYGNNGFFVLKDGNSLTDQSPNSNNFSLGGGTLTKSEDNPSNVFCTLNRNIVQAGGVSGRDANVSASLNNGNTTGGEGTAVFSNQLGTIFASSGKYYAECKFGGDQYCSFGVTSPNFSDASLGSYPGASLTGVNSAGIYGNGGLARVNGSTIFTDSNITTDTICLAMDLDNGALYIRRNNGSWMNSGNPESGATKTGAITLPSDTYSWIVTSHNNSGSGRNYMKVNFGNGYFGTDAVSSAGTNASNNGIFEYDVPAGYTALSTKGLNL